MIRNISMILFIAILLFVGCTTQSNELNDFYRDLEYKMSNSKDLRLIKTVPQDSLYLFIYEIEPYVRTNLVDSVKYSALFKLDRRQFSKLNNNVKYDILLRAFKKYLNHEHINVLNIREEAIEAARARELERRYLEANCERELRSLIQLNNRTCNVGDTLKLFFQVKGNSNRYDIVYRQYPSSKAYDLADDTLRVLGVLNSKIYDKARSGNASLDNNDIMNLWFNVKIIYIINHASYSGMRLLKSGDDFKFELAFYGMKIK